MSKRKTTVFDATGQKPGRLATKIATALMGKHKATYEPNLDNGDKVVVENAAGIVLTGKKIDQKVFRHHSNYPGGLKEIPIKKIMKENPEEVIRHAVVKMLPKNKLRDKRLQRLTIKK